MFIVVIWDVNLLVDDFCYVFNNWLVKNNGNKVFKIWIGFCLKIMFWGKFLIGLEIVFCDILKLLLLVVKWNILLFLIFRFWGFRGNKVWIIGLELISEINLVKINFILFIEFVKKFVRILLVIFEVLFVVGIFLGLL